MRGAAGDGVIGAMTADDLHRRLDALWRMESPKLLARLARITGNLDTAEELAQDVLVAALERWPRDGVPDNPAAWLMTTAKRRALDHLRRLKMQGEKHEEIGADLEAQEALVVPDFVDALDAARQDEIGDDLLRLIFTACHPVLSMDARVALTLKLLGGLTTHEIARAYLVPEPTIAQRIVRARRTLADAKVPYETPRGEQLAQQLGAVLEVVYLVFNEGYTATAGSDWMRPALAQEALRLGRMLVEIAPGEPEVHGLLALMEMQASRMAARTDAQGRPILLADQDRGRWDPLLIRRGLAVPTARKAATAVFALLMLCTIPAILTDNAALAIALISLTTFGYTGYTANTLAFPADVFPKQALASVWGLASMGSGFGGMVFMALSGWLIARHGYTPVFIGYGILPVVALALVLFALGPLRKNPVPA